MKYLAAIYTLGFFCLMVPLSSEAKYPDFVYTHCCYDHPENEAVRGTNYCPNGWGHFTKVETCRHRGGEPHK